MSTITELNPRLLALTEAGVSVWLDQIRRSMVEGGELGRMVAVESLRGVTSNPSIFEKAILGSTDYDEDLKALAREQLDARAIYDRLTIKDVQLACDVLATVHPAFVLIQPQESYARVRESLVADLRLVAERCRLLGLDAAADRA